MLNYKIRSNVGIASSDQRHLIAIWHVNPDLVQELFIAIDTREIPIGGIPAAAPEKAYPWRLVCGYSRRNCGRLDAARRQLRIHCASKPVTLRMPPRASRCQRIS